MFPQERKLPGIFLGLQTKRSLPEKKPGKNST
jgi:hypothetical protein